MKYRVTHTTKYSYSEPVPVCHNQVHLAPRKLPSQRCTDFALLLSPAPPDRQQRTDYFGNRVDYFAIHEAHLGLTVTATSHIELSNLPKIDPEATMPWEEVAAALAKDLTPNGLAVQQFAYPSQHIWLPTRPIFLEYARESFPAGRPILAAALDLTARIHKDFRYDPKATTVTSTLEEVFRGRAGVCQDFAHLEIACLRSLGLASRYVSGYLRTTPPPGKQRLVGADASHAWVGLWCGPAGWVDLDPTNNVIPATDHITVAWGRDYADVCPIQGVAIGGGQHIMTVSVDVAEQ